MEDRWESWDEGLVEEALVGRVGLDLEILPYNPAPYMGDNHHLTDALSARWIADFPPQATPRASSVLDSSVLSDVASTSSTCRWARTVGQALTSLFLPDSCGYPTLVSQA
jgi:hypothetical protein